MEQQIMDWTVLDDVNVQTACKHAARMVTRQYGDVMQYEDFLQEAYIIAANHPAKIRAWMEEGSLGYLNRFLWGGLTNLADSENRKFAKYVEYSLDEPR